MNVLFLAQSGPLRMFYELLQTLQKRLQLDKIGFFIADYRFYNQFKKQVPDIESGKYTLLREWDITNRARRRKPDLSLIREYEQRLGNPNLWGPLVADRRIYLGRKCTYFQDYRPRFDHAQMLSILQEGLSCMEKLFDEVEPDFVLSFICATFGEYLAYLFAQARGIAFLNLRPTRIRNYVTFADSIFEPSKRIQTRYQSYLRESIEDEWTRKAREYVNFVRQKHALYEGVTVPNRASDNNDLRKRLLPIRVFYLIKGELEYRLGGVKDNHSPGVLLPYVYRRFLNPLRIRWSHLHLSQKYVSENHLHTLKYAFFPLHKEPEVTLQVYSKPYLNQIEVIRAISQSLPVWMTLVVKEHPASVGTRPLSYYRKILEIPNVRLAHPDLNSKPLVANAHLVATIAGSIGWEAVLRRKPVVLFGHAPYEFLPRSMVHLVKDLGNLEKEIMDLMRDYEYQEVAVTAYVAAMMSESAPVNLYSNLQGRRGVYMDVHDLGRRLTPDEARIEEIETLARYTIGSLRKTGVIT